MEYEYGDYPPESIWWETLEEPVEVIDWDFLFCGVSDEDYEGDSGKDLSCV